MGDLNDIYPKESWGEKIFFAVVVLSFVSSIILGFAVTEKLLPIFMVDQVPKSKNGECPDEYYYDEVADECIGSEPSTGQYWVCGITTVTTMGLLWLWFIVTFKGINRIWDVADELEKFLKNEKERRDKTP